MYKNEVLNQRINEFKKKVDSRESKVDAKIRSLEEQASAIQVQIKSQTDKIVEFELNGEDPKKIDEVKKSNRELRLQLEEIQDSIVGYRDQLEHNSTLYDKDLEGIRQAAHKAAADRKKEMEELSAMIDDKAAQVQALEKELEQIRNKRYFLSQYDDYYTFSSLLSYIDPRAAKLSHSEQERFIKEWVSDPSSLERYFKEKQTQPHQGIQRTVIPRY